MSQTASQIGTRVWSYAAVCRDDGLSYMAYVEQLTFLLFLKMADERAALGQAGPEIPARHSWARLAADDMVGEKLEAHYRETLAALATRGGMLGLIFAKALNRIQVQMASLYPEKGGYVLVDFSEPLDDELQCVLVYKNDLEKVMQLAVEVGIYAAPAYEALKAAMEEGDD